MVAGEADDRARSRTSAHALVRPRPVADDVAQAPELVRRLRVDRREHRLERVQICVNVGDDCDRASACSATLAAAWLAVAALLLADVGAAGSSRRASTPRRVFGERDADARTAQYDARARALWAGSAGALVRCSPRSRRRAQRLSRTRGPARRLPARSSAARVFVLAWLVDAARSARRALVAAPLRASPTTATCRSSPAPGRHAGELAARVRSPASRSSARRRLLGRRWWIGGLGRSSSRSPPPTCSSTRLCSRRASQPLERHGARGADPGARRAGSDSSDVRGRGARGARAHARDQRRGARRRADDDASSSGTRCSTPRGRPRRDPLRRRPRARARRARHHPWKGVAWFALLALPGRLAARARDAAARRPGARPARRARARRARSSPRSRSRTRSRAATRPRRTGRRCADARPELGARRCTAVRADEPERPGPAAGSSTPCSTRTRSLLPSASATARAAALRADPGSLAPSRTSTTSP